MEIEFNTGNVGKPDPGKPVTKKEAVPAPREEASFEQTAALQQKLKDLPPIRHEKVERAKGLVADVKYPPDEMLVGIANLLAMRMK